VRVLVIGNPCNTNCLIAMNNAKEIPRDRWFAMTRLDENRARALVEERWIRETFIPTVQQRGAAVIKARGSSSAASAASAAIDHVRDWVLGTAEADWVSMGVPADGSYGIKEGVIYSYPVTCQGGAYQIVQGLAIDDFSRSRMDATDKELREERDGVKDLI